MDQQELKNKRIGVLMGGLSGEREISLRSGSNCLAALERLGYDAVGIDVGRDIAEAVCRNRVEVAFLALHGKFGEDGVIQGIMELLDIPYTGSRVLASASAMNKVRTKQLAALDGVTTPPFAVFHCGQDLGDACLQVAQRLRFPVMVKPCEEGSSLGVTKVDEPAELEAVVTATCRDYALVMAEEFVSGDELTIGLLETGGGLTALPVLQLVPKAGFYDFHAKYNHGATEFILPARISPELTERCQSLAKQVHLALGCRGFSRVDFLLDAQGVPQLTEINTLPGMTDTSDLPAQARAAGIGYDQLVETMLRSALLP